jgi:hypothetical protein
VNCTHFQCKKYTKNISLPENREFTGFQETMQIPAGSRKQKTTSNRSGFFIYTIHSLHWDEKFIRRISGGSPSGITGRKKIRYDSGFFFGRNYPNTLGSRQNAAE